ncbi:MAG: methylglyoxal synthase [Deltaproteobacteria bacterium HGW-Deltaproteobacteria-15]|jgi:methylglyoxal synthase|nr:MAG: methylglyoxal synthase [Deltaproteobacteria bacterium HGW-Deltaproteobacteria-15]
MKTFKNIALVAHDNRKKDLLEWVSWNCGILLKHRLVCTGTTGKLVEQTLSTNAAMDDSPPRRPFMITKLKSGPLGGDQQLGALITEGKIDFMIFFWDPMQPHPHDVDVKALLRIAVVYNIPIACNRSTADFMISSPLMDEEYEPVVKDYSDNTQTRPAVIVNDNAVGILPLKVIFPITEWKDRYKVAPWLVRLEPSGDNGLENGPRRTLSRCVLWHRSDS